MPTEAIVVWSQAIMRQWNKRFDDFMVKNEYCRSDYDSCVYYKEIENEVYVYLLLYLDDILIASKDKVEVHRLKALLNSEF